jgi:hypothetical protein
MNQDRHNFKINRNGVSYSPVLNYGSGKTQVEGAVAMSAFESDPDTLNIKQQISFEGDTWFDGVAFTEVTAANAAEVKAATVLGAMSRFAYTAAGITEATATLSTNLTGDDNDLVYTSKILGLLGNRISIAYVDPEEETATETVEVDGYAITVTLRSVSTVLSTAAQVQAAIEANAAANALVSIDDKADNDGTGEVIALAATNLAGGDQVGAAALSTDLTGANNDLDITANEDGSSGNDISVAYVDPGVAGATLGIETESDSIIGRRITVNLATGAKVASLVETALVGDNNDLRFTATEAGLAGDGLTITYVDPSANNASLSFAITGTDIVISLATGAGGAITTTANQILTLLNSNLEAQKLVVVTLKSGSNGTGVVTALAETSLANGSDGGAITSTATLVAAALNAMSEEWVTAANKSGNNGTGVVTALARTSLSGGVDQIAGTLFSVAR